MKLLRSLWQVLDALWTFLIYIPFCLFMAWVTGEFEEDDTNLIGKS